MIKNPKEAEKNAQVGKKLTMLLSVLYVIFEIWITIVEAVNNKSVDMKSLLIGIVMLALIVAVILFGYKYFVIIVGIRFVLNTILFIMTIAATLNANVFYISDVLCFSFGTFVSIYGVYLMFFSNYVREYYNKLRSKRTLV